MGVVRAAGHAPRGTVGVVDNLLSVIDDGALPLGAELLGALEGDEGELEVVRRLLERSLVRRLVGLGGGHEA